MHKLIIKTFMLGLLLGFQATAYAVPIILAPGDDCGFDTGCTYLGTASGPGPLGNDSVTTVESTFGLSDLFLIDKSDNGGQINFLFDNSPNDPNGALTGAWKYIGSLTDPVVYMSVKSGNQFALYKYDPTRSDGLWSTENLAVGNGNNGQGNIPGLSHLSFFGVEGREVPEPSSIALLGLGLLALAFKRKR